MTKSTGSSGQRDSCDAFSQIIPIEAEALRASISITTSGRNEETTYPCSRRIFVQSCEHLGFQVLYLEFDIQECALAIAPQHLTQSRELWQLRGFRAVRPVTLPTWASWQTTAVPQAVKRTSNSKPPQPWVRARSNDSKVFSGAFEGDTAAAMAEEEGKVGHCGILCINRLQGL